MRKKIFTFGPILLVSFMMVYMLIAPNICIEGAKDGLLLWFNKVLPSLLPFIILTNILSNLGIVFKISRFATPITKRLFSLPGISFFVFSMGLIAGYPMGAKLTKQLLDNKQLTFSEAQRTLCFCNNCGPLFMIGTIGTAMLSNPKIGYFLVLVHFLSAFIVGVIFSHYQASSRPSLNNRAYKQPPSHSFYYIFNTSVQNAMDTIVYVGGYIIFFSVIASIIKSSPLIHHVLTCLSNLLSIPIELILGTLIGSLELSTGIAFLCTHASLNSYTLALISAILGFGGFCVYFQSSYVLQDSNLSLKLYLFSKLTQAFIAFSLTCIAYPLFFANTSRYPLAMLSFWSSILLFLILVIPNILKYIKKASPLN